MRKLLLLALLLAPSLVVAEGVTVLPRFPGRSGYAFDKPRILLQQRLFGLYHGVTLLAQACKGRDEAAAAYRSWRERQEGAIATARIDLGRHYFGGFAEEATDGQLVQAIGLKRSLEPEPGGEQLDAACATLPEALTKFRYDLGGQFSLQVLLARLQTAAGIEGKISYCRRRAGDSGMASLNEAAVKWQAQYAPALREARDAVAPRWEEAGLDRPLEQWLQRVGKAVERSTLARECNGLEPWLSTPAADPDQPFRASP